MVLDNALQTYLETFGESHKILRKIFVSNDSVFILFYSLIMLNTDQHNPQVKKIITEEEFINNNMAINEGEDLLRGYL